MKFPKNGLINDRIFSNMFLENVHNIILGGEVIHHSHIAGKIIGYAHNFCNQKAGENKIQINVITHNLFGFVFFFFKKRFKVRGLANNKFFYWWIKLNKCKFCKYW